MQFLLANIGFFEHVEMKLHNTKHPIKVTQPEIKIPCSRCDEKCQTSEELSDHIEDYLQEIRDLDVTELNNGHKKFECNICQYQTSKYDEVRKHLISHTKVSLTFKEMGRESIIS